MTYALRGRPGPVGDQPIGASTWVYAARRLSAVGGVRGPSADFSDRDHGQLGGQPAGPPPDGMKTVPIRLAGRSVKAFDVPGTYDSEVPAVHGGDLRDLKALGDGHDRSISAAESQASVLLGHLGHPAHVRQGQL